MFQLSQEKRLFSALGFGELLLRCQPFFQGEGINRSKLYEFAVGGTEANVMSAMKAYDGLRTGMLTVLPANERGAFVRNELRAAGISDDFIMSGDPMARVGVYYYSPGVGELVGDHVEYDRLGSAFTSIDAGSIPVDVFSAARVLHVSGVTLALNEHVRETALWLVEEAKKHGTIISCDYNYRRQLWGSEEKALKAFERLLPMVDYFNVSCESCELSFGLSAQTPLEHCQYFTRRYGIDVISLTQRTRGNWTAYLYDAGTEEFVQSDIYHNLPVLGRIGSGDAAVGGCLGALLAGHTLQQAVDLMSGFMAAKMSTRGDMLLSPSLAMIRGLIARNRGDVKGEASNR